MQKPGWHTKYADIEAGRIKIHIWVQFYLENIEFAGRMKLKDVHLKDIIYDYVKEY